MGEIYSDLIYSNFPTEVSTMERVQDVTASAKQYVDLYNQHYSSGNFNAANQVLEDHPELLKMLINARVFNQLRDEIIATQRLFVDDIESYIFNVVKIRGNWSASTKYVKFNIVYKDNLPYMAIADDIPIGSLPTDITYWYPLAIKGEQGESGVGLTPRGAWNDTTQYYKDDMVAYNNILWAALENNLNYVPNDSSSVWLKMLAFSSEYLTYDNTETGLDATTLQDAINEVDARVDDTNVRVEECFQSVSNGKTLVASAITDKGVATDATATFEIMANNISIIETGVDTSDADATAEFIYSGKTAYVKNEKVTGTMVARWNSTMSPSIRGMRNLVYNNGFDSQAYGWTLDSAYWNSDVGYWTDGIVLNNNSGGAAQIFSTAIHIIEGHKYYASFAVKKTSNGIGGGQIDLVGGGHEIDFLNLDDSIIPLNEWALLSGITTATMTGDFNLRIYTWATNFDVYVDNAVLIDLTDTFGVGREPDYKYEIDAFLMNSGLGFTACATADVPPGAYLSYGNHGYPVLFYRDDDLRPDNIRKDATILGVQGALDTNDYMGYNFPLTISTTQPTPIREGHIWVNSSNGANFWKTDIVENITPSSPDNTLFFVVGDDNRENSSCAMIKQDTVNYGRWFEHKKNKKNDAGWLVSYLDYGNNQIRKTLNYPMVYSKVGGVLSIETAYMWNGSTWITLSTAGKYAMATYSSAMLGIYNYNNSSGTTTFNSSFQDSSGVTPLQASSDGTYVVFRQKVYKRTGDVYADFFTIPTQYTYNGITYSYIPNQGICASISKDGRRLGVAMTQYTGSWYYHGFAIYKHNGTTFELEQFVPISSLSSSYYPASSIANIDGSSFATSFQNGGGIYDLYMINLTSSNVFVATKCSPPSNGGYATNFVTMVGYGDYYGKSFYTTNGITNSYGTYYMWVRYTANSDGSVSSTHGHFWSSSNDGAFVSYGQSRRIVSADAQGLIYYPIYNGSSNSPYTQLACYEHSTGNYLTVNIVGVTFLSSSYIIRDFCVNSTGDKMAMISLSGGLSGYHLHIFDVSRSGDTITLTKLTSTQITGLDNGNGIFIT